MGLLLECYRGVNKIVLTSLNLGNFRFSHLSLIFFLLIRLAPFLFPKTYQFPRKFPRKRVKIPENVLFPRKRWFSGFSYNSENPCKMGLWGYFRIFPKIRNGNFSMWRGTLLDSKKGKLTDSFPSRDSYPWEVHLDSFFDSLLGSKLRLISYFFILNGLTFQAYFSLGEILFSLIFQPFSAISYFWLRSR